MKRALSIFLSLALMPTSAAFANEGEDNLKEIISEADKFLNDYQVKLWTEYFIKKGLLESIEAENMVDNFIKEKVPYANSKNKTIRISQEVATLLGFAFVTDKVLNGTDRAISWTRRKVDPMFIFKSKEYLSALIEYEQNAARINALVNERNAGIKHLFAGDTNKLIKRVGNLDNVDANRIRLEKVDVFGGESMTKVFYEFDDGSEFSAAARSASELEDGAKVIGEIEARKVELAPLVTKRSSLVVDLHIYEPELRKTYVKITSRAHSALRSTIWLVGLSFVINSGFDVINISIDKEQDMVNFTNMLKRDTARLAKILL